MMRPFDYFSQTRQLQKRKEKNLHPISEMRRFYTLVCCFFCSVAVSVVYAFDLFSTEFRDQFQLSGGDLTTISTVGLVFCYFTIPYSFIFENLGPFTLFWVCFVVALIGGLCLGLVFDGKIQGNTVTIAVFYAFLNTASGLIDTTYISTLFEIFPRNRGPVVALAKVMTGLGSSVLSCLSATLFENNISGFIYFLMAFCMVVSAWASFTVVLPPYMMNWWRRRGKTEEEIKALKSTEVYYATKTVPYRRLAIGYIVVIVLLIFFTVEAPVVAYSKTISRGSKLALGVLTIVFTLCIFLMLLPIRWLGGMDEPAPEVIEEDLLESELKMVRAREEVEGWTTQESSLDVAIDSTCALDAMVTVPVTKGKPTPVATRVHAENFTKSRQDPRYPGSFKDYLLTVDMWLIMLFSMCSACLFIIVMFNSSTISVAITGRKRSIELSSLYTAFFGIASSLGRIAFGLYEAFVQQQDPNNRRFLITLCFFVAPALSCIGGTLLLVLPGSALLFPFILIYLGSGISGCTFVLVFPCLFQRHHNALYNLCFLLGCVSVICFNRLMFGMTVDKQHKRLNLPSDVECNEKICVRMPLIVGTCLAFVACILAIVVHIRYRRFVRRVCAVGEAGKDDGDATGTVEVAEKCCEPH